MTSSRPFNLDVLVVRPGVASDAPTLEDFQIKMALETEGLNLDAENVKRGVQRVFLDPPIARYYVTEWNDRIIGCLLICYEWSEWRNGTILWIESVYINPEFRGKGVYKKMYHAIQQMVNNDDGLKGIRLYVKKSNKNAQQVYKKLGMNDDHYLLYEWQK